MNQGHLATMQESHDSNDVREADENFRNLLAGDSQDKEESESTNYQVNGDASDEEMADDSEVSPDKNRRGLDQNSDSSIIKLEETESVSLK